MAVGDKGRSDHLKNLGPVILEVVCFSNSEGKRSHVCGCRFVGRQEEEVGSGKENKVEEEVALMVNSSLAATT